jgi:RimJ/RimL family protein N-acetyltransferase
MKSSSPTGSTARARREQPDVQQVRHFLSDGTAVVVRPIQASDVELERAFIERLSPKSRRFRFLGSIKTPSAQLLRQFTQPHLTGGVAYVALIGEGSGIREIGVCRYSTGEDGGSCECAVSISDEWQGKGLATILMHRLIDTARDNGFQRMYSIDASDNEEMRELAGHLGFKCETHPDDPTLVLHTLALQSSGSDVASGATSVTNNLTLKTGSAQSERSK